MAVFDSGNGAPTVVGMMAEHGDGEEERENKGKNGEEEGC